MNAEELPAEKLLSSYCYGITRSDLMYSSISADGRTGQNTGECFTVLPLASSQ